MGVQGALKRAMVVLVAVALQLQATGPLQAHTASGDSNNVHTRSVDTPPAASQSGTILPRSQPNAAPGDCALAGLVSLPAYNGDVEATPAGGQWSQTGFGGDEARTGEYGIRDAWAGDGYIAWSADHAGNPAVYVGGKQYVLSVWIFIQSTSTYRLKWGEQVSPPSGFTPPTYGDHALLDNPSITGGAWHQVCLPWTPSANISGSEIVFTIEWDDGHFVFLDDLQLWGEPGVPAEQVLGTGSGTYGNNPSRLEAEPVNTATGNYVSHATDLALPGVGLPLVFSRTYNSLDPTVGALGVGWTHSYAAHLELEGSGAVRFFAGDGAQLLFTPDGSGGFIRPSGAYTDLEPLIDGTYELTRRDQVVEHFDADGLLLSQTDRNGNALTFSYTNDLLTAITDTVGRGVSLTYDGSNRLTSLGAPLSRSVTYTYDGSGRLSTVTDLAGETTTYGYDTSDRLTTITDANNHVLVSNEYDTDGRVSAQTDALANRATFDWDPNTSTSTYTDAAGNEWTDVYDGTALQSYTDPLGHTTGYTYDADFNVASITDANGHTTTFTYDANGNLLTQLAPAPLSYSQSWTYTANNDVATFTDPRGHTTTYSYDGAGNLTSVGQPGSVITTYGRDPNGSGLLVSLTDPRGKTTTFAYDADGNLATTTSPLAEETTRTYDAAGRLLTLVDPRGHATGADPADFTTSFAYDAADRVLSATDALDHVTSYTYDPVGNRLSITDPNEHTTSWSYDADNRLAAVSDELDHATAYAYDEVGNLLTRTDANAHVTTYTYDDAQRLTQVEDPLAHTTGFTYDLVGNLTTRTDASSQQTSYAYDVLNRLTAVDYPGTVTTDVTFTYDANGNRTLMSDGAGTVTYTYDDLDRLLGVTRGSDSFTYAYDDAGHVTARTYPDATEVDATYDDDGRLATITLGSATTTYTYDPAGQLLAATLPNGVTEARAYDAAGRLTDINAASASSTLTDLAYTYDAAGNPLTLTDPDGTTTYGYDDVDRLTIASGPLLGSQTYTYDPVGNRTALTTGAGSTSYAYDAADRLTSVDDPTSGTITYVYDANGNQTAAGPDQFSYDAANRLLQVTDVGADASSGISRLSDSALGAQGNDVSEDPTISANGRYVAFTSEADNLVADDTNAEQDVFLVDRVDGTLSRVSTDADAEQANDRSMDPALTADGGALVFRSQASNLVAGDTNGGSWDIFIKDLASGDLERLSVSSAEAQANGGSDAAVPSADGAVVAFLSSASNLVAGDTNAANDIFVRDRAAGTTTRISVDSAGAQANAASASPSISADGRYVAFWSEASNLVSGDSNGVRDIFIHDRVSGSTSRVSLDSSGTEANGLSSLPAISADGSAVAFRSDASNLVSGDTNAAPDVFVRDLGTGTTSRVSVSSAGTQAGDDALNPSMSADGRYVAFYSTANNLVSGDTNNRGDIFVRDRTAGTTVRVNLSATGAQGNDTSNFPVISADGQVVAFHAKASSLVPGDTNAVRDVFVVGPAYAVVSSYTYDGDGLRLSASVDGTTSGWVWDVNAALPLLVTERDVSGDSLRDYTYGLGLTPLSMTSDAATSYYHTDALGSVRAISDASGDPQWSYAYAPFGTPLASDQIDPNAPDNPLRYTGQYLDPTGLYHLRARQYDPTVGRFLSTDPVAAAIGDPYVATYVYVANGPARYTDPSGRCFIVCGAAVGAVVGGLVSGVSYAITAGDEFSLSGLAGHALAGAAAGAISGATLGLASGVAVGGAALPAVERLALQGVGGYVGGLAGLAGSRLLGDPISGRGAVTQMVLSVTGAGVAPRMAPGSSFIDQFHWRSLFGTPQSAAATALGVGAGLAGTK